MANYPLEGVRYTHRTQTKTTAYVVAILDRVDGVRVVHYTKRLADNPTWEYISETCSETEFINNYRVEDYVDKVPW